MDCVHHLQTQGTLNLQAAARQAEEPMQPSQLRQALGGLSDGFGIELYAHRRHRFTRGQRMPGMWGSGPQQADIVFREIRYMVCDMPGPATSNDQRQFDLGMLMPDERKCVTIPLSTSQDGCARQGDQFMDRGATCQEHVKIVPGSVNLGSGGRSSDRIMGDMTLLAHDLETPYTIAAATAARFRKDGHITLADVLSPATLAYYGQRIGELVAQRANKEPMEKRGTYGKAFQQIINLWTVDAVAKEFVSSRRLARIAAELMGVDGVRLYHDQALYKEAGGGFTPWHCDQMYWPLASHETCTAWIPFQAVPLEMGPLSFAVGSHRADFGRHLFISDDSERIIAKKVSDLPMVEMPFNLGDVSFHYGWTFHRAPPNRTHTLRQVMTIIYMDDAMRLAEPTSKEQGSDGNMFCPGTKVGEIIDTPMNPVLYHRQA
jgi:ectoine hydroxylase-related dioxygenase (phytanoyl-CoA dioxygenase family)